jgi:hypothetical protein
MKEDRDQRQFFKDLGATAEQTVEEVRGAEENYFSMMQKMVYTFHGLLTLMQNSKVTPSNTLRLLLNLHIS